MNLPWSVRAGKKKKKKKTKKKISSSNSNIALKCRQLLIKILINIIGERLAYLERKKMVRDV